MPTHTPYNNSNGNSPSVEEVLDGQIIKVKRGRLNTFGFEPAWNAYFDFYLCTKYMAEPLLQMEDVTFHLYLRKNLNDNDPNWKMPSIPFMKRNFGMGQTKLDKIIERLTKAKLLTKVSGKRRGSRTANVSNEYILSDPIPDLEQFLLVAHAGAFGQSLREEWARYLDSQVLETDPQAPPLPILGKGALPEMGKGALPIMGKHKHTSFKQTSNEHTVTTEAVENNSEGIQSFDSSESDVVAVLIEKGISERVAKRLAAKYSHERITEKIEILNFIQHSKREKIGNPSGWLRRAIEDDYSKPDGFKSQAQLVEEAKEREIKVAESMAALQLIEEEQSQKAQKQKQKAEARLNLLKEQYGTTQADIDLWNETLAEFKETTTAAAYAFLSKTVLLSMQEGIALIGVTNSFSKDWLEVQMSRRIMRVLKTHYGDSLTAVKFVVLEDTILVTDSLKSDSVPDLHYQQQLLLQDHNPA